jgi:hypothetical protein
MSAHRRRLQRSRNTFSPTLTVLTVNTNSEATAQLDSQMLIDSQVSADIFSLVATEELVDSQDIPLAVKLARLRDNQERREVDLKRHIKDLAALYDYATSQQDASTEYLTHVANVLFERERAAAEIISPGTETLRNRLTRRPDIAESELGEIFQKSLDISEQYLKAFSEIREKLLTLAGERIGVSSAVKRAKPTNRKVDWAELSREHIGRYPKIRARLAE